MPFHQALAKSGPGQVGFMTLVLLGLGLASPSKLDPVLLGSLTSGLHISKAYATGSPRENCFRSPPSVGKRNSISP